MADLLSPLMHVEKPYASTLHMAAQAGNTDAVRKALRAGVLVTTKDVIGRSALQWAIVCKQTEAAKVLLVNTPRQALQCTDKHGRTALHYAAGLGNAILTRIILDRGASINTRDKQGVTALHLAAENVKPDIPSLLLERGADRLAEDDFGRLPVHYALRKCAMAAVYLLAVKEEAIRISPLDGIEFVAASALASETLKAVTPETVSPSEFWAKRKERIVSAKAARSSGSEDSSSTADPMRSPALPCGKDVEAADLAVQVAQSPEIYERLGAFADPGDRKSSCRNPGHFESDSVPDAPLTANHSPRSEWEESRQVLSYNTANASHIPKIKRDGVENPPTLVARKTIEMRTETLRCRPVAPCIAFPSLLDHAGPVEECGVPVQSAAMEALLAGLQGGLGAGVGEGSWRGDLWGCKVVSWDQNRGWGS